MEEISEQWRLIFMTRLIWFHDKCCICFGLAQTYPQNDCDWRSVHSIHFYWFKSFQRFTLKSKKVVFIQIRMRRAQIYQQAENVYRFMKTPLILYNVCFYYNVIVHVSNVIDPLTAIARRLWWLWLSALEDDSAHTHDVAGDCTAPTHGDLEAI